MKLSAPEVVGGFNACGVFHAPCIRQNRHLRLQTHKQAFDTRKALTANILERASFQYHCGLTAKLSPISFYTIRLKAEQRLYGADYTLYTVRRFRSGDVQLCAYLRQIQSTKTGWTQLRHSGPERHVMTRIFG